MAPKLTRVHIEICSSRLFSLMDHVDPVELYRSSETILVFPTENVTASWARRTVEHCGVVQQDRFISWDHFKERIFRTQEKQKPANQLFRDLFAQQVLESNRHRYFLHSLISPKYRNDVERYHSTISRTLRGLSPLMEVPNLRVLIGPELFKDIEEIYKRYQQFLDIYGRYEPEWQRRDAVSDGQSYCIFHPQILTDFSNYEPRLKELPNLHFAKTAGKSDTLKLYAYDDHRQELYHCLEHIGLLIQQGVRPEHIAITLADYDSLHSRLIYIATNLGIHVNRRKAQALTAYPSVTWLEILLDMGEDFSFETVRRFLLHAGLPWKNPAGVRSLILKATDTGLVEGGRAAWMRLDKNMSQIFIDLGNILNARNMDGLVGALYHFLNTHLDVTLWSTVDEAAWLRCIAVIRELGRELPAFTGIKVKVLPFVLIQLRSTSYLPQNRNGIYLYDYRASAGLEIDYHFCLNFNAECTTVNQNIFPFLREDVARQIFSATSSSTKHMLRVYTCSGRNIWLSYSQRSCGKEVLPSSLFLDADEVIEGYRSAPRYAEIAEPNGAWNSDVPTAHNTILTQLGAFKAELMPKSLSVTRLESWMHCPFGYLWEQCKLQPLNIQLVMYPYARIGTILHKIMEKVYRNISEKSGRYFSAAHLDSYHRIVSDVLTMVFEDSTLLKGIPLVLHDHLRQLFSTSTTSVLEDDVKKRDGFRIYALEAKLSHDFTECDSRALEGRADRIMQDPSDGSLTLFDYKTGNIPTASDILGRNSVQLAAYSLLLRRSKGHIVTEAGYYGTKREGAYSAVFDCRSDGANSLKQRLPIDDAELIKQLEQSVIEQFINMSTQTSKGNFLPPTQGCPSCRHKAVCRHHFTLTMKGE